MGMQKLLLPGKRRILVMETREADFLTHPFVTFLTCFPFFMAEVNPPILIAACSSSAETVSYAAEQPSQRMEYLWLMGQVVKTLKLGSQMMELMQQLLEKMEEMGLLVLLLLT